MNLWLHLIALIDLAFNIYLIMVLIAAILAVIACFWPHHPLALKRFPLIDKLTWPVFSFLKRLFHSSLEIQFQNGAQSLDAAPFVTLLLVYLVKRLVIFLIIIMLV